MTQFAVTPEKNLLLQKKMAELNIKEEDLLEQFIKGSGKGGQKINKTSSTVYIKHIPTGIEVRSSKERSQSVNRFLARRLLVEKIEMSLSGKESPAQKKVNKLKKQKQKRKKRTALKLQKDDS